MRATPQAQARIPKEAGRNAPTLETRGRSGKGRTRGGGREAKGKEKESPHGIDEDSSLQDLTAYPRRIPCSTGAKVRGTGLSQDKNSSRAGGSDLDVSGEELPTRLDHDSTSQILPVQSKKAAREETADGDISSEQGRLVSAVGDFPSRLGVPYQPFQPFGIEAFRTMAYKPEICINFLKSCCKYGRSCHRVHPLNALPFLNRSLDKVTLDAGPHTPTTTSTTGTLTTAELNHLTPTTHDNLSSSKHGTRTEESVRVTETNKVAPFQVHGIDALPTNARHNKICIEFLKALCNRGSNCPRIHPLDTGFYLERLKDKSSVSLFYGHFTHKRILPSDVVLATMADAESATDPIHIQAEIPKPPVLTPPSIRGFVADNTLAGSSAHSEMPTTVAKANPIPGLSSNPKKSVAPRQEPGRPEHKSGQFFQETPISEVETWELPLSADDWLDSDSSVSTSSGSPQLASVPLSSRRSSDTEEESPRRRTSSRRQFQRPFDERSVCQEWLQNRCMRKPCRFSHRESVDSNLSSDEEAVKPGVHRQRIDHKPSLAPKSTSQSEKANQRPEQLPVKTVGVCHGWSEGTCWRGKSCPYLHVEPSLDSKKHPLPPHDEICVKWLRGECMQDYACNYIHRDVEYDRSLPRRSLLPVPIRHPPTIITRTLHKHIKVKISDGFEVEQVVTGFETSWVYLGNIPKSVKQEAITKLVQGHGNLIDLRMPERVASTFIVVRARFDSATEASKACATLNGLEALGSTITARLSLENSSEFASLDDTSVRVVWEAPSKTAYGGYSTQEKANQAIEKCRTIPFADRSLRATPHTGLPAVRMYNVRFDGVPAETDLAEMKAYCLADDIVWGKMNYTSLQDSIRGIQRMLRNGGTEILDFEIVPPPYRGGLITGWAHLPTPAQARALCDRIHSRKPNFTGGTRIVARHVQSLEYSLNNELYGRLRNDLEVLKATASQMGHLSVTFRHLPTSVSVRLSGEDMKQLSQLKAELDIVLSGEIVRGNGKIAWDPFFYHPRGLNFISALERKHPPAVIRVERYRRQIRLFGPSAERLLVRTKILEEIDMLKKLSVYTIPVDGQIIGLFLKDELPVLSQSLGEDNVFLDLWNRSLQVRGSLNVRNEAFDALARTRRRLRPDKPRKTTECPVCFDQVTVPITLCCAHSWCKLCLIRYLTTAINQKYFPITCLGDDAKCQEKIPLSCAFRLLPKADFETLVETSYNTHIQRNPTEFSYCPTPDCQQVYRPIARVQIPQSQLPSKILTKNSEATSMSGAVSLGTTLQCPSCLVRICASCQTEAHDGFSCVRPEEGDRLFEEWMKNNDVKPCPGCKMPIEKVMGCHHVTCTVCSTHLCWICLTPFPNGSGVYSHMLAMHGSFV